jgi:hypothetical protein
MVNKKMSKLFVSNFIATPEGIEFILTLYQEMDDAQENTVVKNVLDAQDERG